jgi:hypothetical protein
MPDQDVSAKVILANNILNGSSIVSKDDIYQDRAVVGVIPHDKLTDRFDNISNPTLKNITITQTLTTTPSSTISITAAGGLTSTNPIMYVVGNGGPITVTKNPAIAAGVAGQHLTIVGTSDTNTVTFTDGNGLHTHGPVVLGAHDLVHFIYDADENQWLEISRNAPRSDKAWSFNSPAGASGTFYAGGFYEFSSTVDNFNPSINFGTANNSKAAHFMIVLGEQTVDELTIRVTGTSITDTAVRTTSDTQDIVIPSGTPVDTYYETSKKWLGQVAIVVVSGTAKNCNYGFCKYWDNNNVDFTVLGLEVTWLAGASDANPNILLYHHKTTGWTYNALAAPTPPTALAAMATDHVTEKVLTNGEAGAWKRTDLTQVVTGSQSEGIIWSYVTTANKAFGQGDLLLTIKPS